MSAEERLTRIPEEVRSVLSDPASYLERGPREWARLLARLWGHLDELTDEERRRLADLAIARLRGYGFTLDDVDSLCAEVAEAMLEFNGDYAEALDAMKEALAEVGASASDDEAWEVLELSRLLLDLDERYGVKVLPRRDLFWRL